ncbi:MAG: UDP-glucose/GDP-mannose dehydrogenase family protein [Parcubacteria group bacterium GW2011_GWA2_47_26]|nr:MAG: UDP-glucose/GDP-mannose dehydrogenase family protein [Parcubacteria group bacterium GW2011_GWA2_47_26]
MKKCKIMLPKLEEVKIAIVGLGYVGLPLAVAFGKSRFAPVIGLNKSKARIDSLLAGHDPNKDVSDEEMAKAKIEFTLDPIVLTRANFIIVTVPTPINQAKQPDLTLVREASHMVGEHIQKGSVVVYESTVYPGVSEDVCVPIIEKLSGLKCGVDWKIGYSPERVNPGDHEHTLERIVKVVSGMDQETLELVAAVYGEICKGGVHKAPNIKTAEAAKVIENIQRDLNIALMNELTLIFHRLEINTKDVVDAAGTKWNFHKYQPGLVGGHCIGVDPYYLTYRAQELGYNPEVILAGRRINDWMSEYVADLTIRGLVEAGKVVQGSRVLVMGLTFKENIRDMRNSKIQDTIKKLKSYGVQVLGYDPNLYEEEVNKFGVEYVKNLANLDKVDGIILATLHSQFKALSYAEFLQYYNGNGRGVFVDIKSYFLKEARIQKDVIYKSL